MPSIEDNHRHWNDDYDWSQRGDEWTPDPRWKQEILDHALVPWLERGRHVLEIGPGGGRWTAELLAYEPARLIGVDLSENCVALCRERFADATAAEFHVNDGKSLSVVEDASIDFAWSFDVFVHMEIDTIRTYLQELARVMRPRARAVIHYPSIDRAQLEDARLGWRGDVTSAQMTRALQDAGFDVLHDYYEPWISSTNTSVVIFEKRG